MIDDKRYVLIDFPSVTQQMVDSCIQTSIDTLRHVRFANDATDWVVLKWKNDKPVGLWNKFPVYSQDEMLELLSNDLNT